MIEKSLHIIRKKSDNSKIIKKIGNTIKKGIRKDITIKNIKEEKNESIDGKIRKNILKHKINEKNEKINRPENLKQNSIKTNNTKNEENQKNIKIVILIIILILEKENREMITEYQLL